MYLKRKEVFVKEQQVTPHSGAFPDLN